MVAELSALSAPNLDSPVDRTLYREDRKRTLRERLKHVQPAFVVFYGTTYQLEWDDITGHEFDSNGFCFVGRTIAVMTLHPTSRPPPPIGHWVTIGKALQRQLNRA